MMTPVADPVAGAETASSPSPTRLGMFIEFNQSMTGGPRTACNLVRKLDRQHYEPIIFTNRPSELTKVLDGLAVEVHILEQPSRIGSDDGASVSGGPIRKLAAVLDVLAYNRRIRKLIRQRGIQVMWVRNVKGVLLTSLAARRCGVPVVWDIGMEGRSRGILRLFHNFAFKRSERVVTQGSVVAPSIFYDEQLVRFGHKIIVNPTGVPDDRAERLKRPVTTPPSPDGRVRVLCVATLNERKNQMLVLRAVASLKEEFPNLLVRIVGPATDPQYEQQMLRYIECEDLGGHVELLGWRSDVEELLHASDLFTLTSRTEGVPQAVLEAMYARVPVVSTAAGGVPDVIEDGRTGWVVPIDDQDAYNDALAEALAHADRRKAFANAAYEIATKQFTAARWCERYQQIFDQLSNHERDKA